MLATMGRKRSTDHHLPPRMHQKHGCYYYVTPTPRRWIRLSKDLTEAKTLWAKLESGTPLPIGQAITIGYLIARYRREVLPEKSAKTQVEQSAQLTRLDKVFGAMAPDDVLPVHIGQYLDKRGQKAPVAANREIALLSHVYTKALRWGFAQTNPCRGIERNKEKPRERYITDAEYAAVLAVAPGPVGLAMEIAYYTGQRLGDVLKMRWADLAGNVLYVIQDKTGAKLHIEIGPELADVLASARQTGKLRSLTIIHNRHGQPYTVNGFESQFSKARAKARITDFHFHDIRAKHATDKEDLGEHVRAIQASLGHASITTTEIYLRQKRVRKVKSLTRIVDTIVDTQKNGSGGSA